MTAAPPDDFPENIPPEEWPVPPTPITIQIRSRARAAPESDARSTADPRRRDFDRFVEQARASGYLPAWAFGQFKDAYNSWPPPAWRKEIEALFAADQCWKDAVAARAKKRADTDSSDATARNAWRSQLDRATDKTGQVRVATTTRNAVLFFTHHPSWTGLIRHNAFSYRTIFTHEPPWSNEVRPTTPHDEVTDRDVPRLQIWFQREEHLFFSKEAIEDAVALAAEANEVHPVREYFNALPNWDGVPRIDAFCYEYLGAKNNQYHRAVGRAFFISATARVWRPGCKVDTMLVLHGAQGEKKSTVFETLAGEFFSDTLIDLSKLKDAYEQVQGVWIYEWQEIDQLSKHDQGRVKAFTTQKNDRYRESYGRRVGQHPRQGVFVGTCNPEQFLRDPTGGRRFHPVRCGRIELDAIRRDRDQLWAEALHRFRSGEPWHLSGADSETAADEQEQRRVRHPWEDRLPALLFKHMEWRETGAAAHTILDALEVSRDKQDDVAAMKLGAILANKPFHWEKRRVTIGKGETSHREWRYFPPNPAVGPTSPSSNAGEGEGGS